MIRSQIICFDIFSNSIAINFLFTLFFASLIKTTHILISSYSDPKQPAHYFYELLDYLPYSI